MAYEYTRESNLWESTCELVSYKTILDEDGVVVEEERPIRREVFCRVGSLYQKEFMRSYEEGVNAQWKVVVYYYDYNDEPEVIYDNHLYHIYRTYISGDYIELYLRDDSGIHHGQLDPRILVDG